MESLRPRGMIEYIGILWRKKLLIFLVAVSVSVASFLIIRRIPNFYESRAVIVISNEANGQGSGNDGRLLSSPSLTALTQRMTGDGNLAAIARRYNLYRQAGKPLDLDAAVGRLRRDI